MTITTLPKPDNQPLRGGPTLRWGVLAPGRIAGDWVASVHGNTEQRVVAVASRTLSRAETFAATHGIERAYGSYDQLLAQPDVDIVYIAAPHSEHHALALQAIAAGKHILVEKPIATSAHEARSIRDAAGAAGVLAMEALWSRYLPQTSVVAKLIANGDLGDIRLVLTSFGFAAPFDPTSRLFDPALAGGALLDLGVYTAWFAHFVLGNPATVSATGTLASTGVDDHSVVALGYDSPAVAALTTTILVDTPATGMICGTAARVELEKFMSVGDFRVLQRGADPLNWSDPNALEWRDGLCYSAAAAAAYVADGLLESPLHGLDDSIAVLEVLDAARAQLGAV